MTQKSQILAYLKSGRSLTPLIALKKFGCLSLSQRIGELRRDGWMIRGSLTRVSKGKRVGMYWL